MKNQIRTTILAAPALFSAAVFAYPLESDVTSSANVYIKVSDGVATISGIVDSPIEKT